GCDITTNIHSRDFGIGAYRLVSDKRSEYSLRARAARIKFRLLKGSRVISEVSKHLFSEDLPSAYVDVCSYPIVIRSPATLSVYVELVTFVVIGREVWPFGSASSKSQVNPHLPLREELEVEIREFLAQILVMSVLDKLGKEAEVVELSNSGVKLVGASLVCTQR